MLVCFDASYDRERGGRKVQEGGGTAYKPPPRPNSSTAVRALAVSQAGPVAASAACCQLLGVYSFVYEFLSFEFAYKMSSVEVHTHTQAERGHTHIDCVRGSSLRAWSLSPLGAVIKCHSSFGFCVVRSVACHIACHPQLPCYHSSPAA